MPPTLLEPSAKEALRKAVRALRPVLLAELMDAARGEYRLDVPIGKAKLPEARRLRRERLEAWLGEQERAGVPRERGLAEAVKEAAHTLLNRLVFLRVLEHHELLSPPVVSGGWSSPAYEREFAHYAGPLMGDPSRGYQALLDVVYAELALELPGLFGPVGLTPLFPIPAGTLRAVVEALDDEALASAWGDDTTLGWIYQYWNDPEREALDDKIARREKIEPHEIASKTQMFTERYMVEWLLQNSLGLTWLCICKKNGWRPDAEKVLPVLEARRAQWRKRREAGEVALDALMPIEPGLESAWKYYVPQPIPDDAVDKARTSIREVKLLDPACGSGHFLVIAFDLFATVYEEEARHRGESWTREHIAESILANNLHGVDIDPRAIQLAAAGLYLKQKTFAPKARLHRVNLVAPKLQLGSLPHDDPARVELRAELSREAGIPPELGDQLVTSLAGVDYLGSLLKVDAAVEDALRASERDLQANPGQGDFFRGYPMQQVKLTAREAKATVLDKLQQFLAKRSSSEDLGLRLDGEQLAAGVRFVRMVKEETYDVVVGNPPYQGLSKAALGDYVAKNYARGKADLYAAFLERGVELVRMGGLCALLTMRGWMFLGQFAELRKSLLDVADLRLIGDVDRGAFEDVPDEVLATVMSVIRRAPPSRLEAVAVQPTPLDDRSRDSARTARKRAGLLAHVGRYEFAPKGFEVIEGEPIVYWWGVDDLRAFHDFPPLGETLLVASGVKTGDDVRFLRLCHEVSPRHIAHPRAIEASASWQFYIKGAAGAAWVEPASQVLAWANSGLQLKVFGAYQAMGTVRLRDSELYFRRGIAFTPIGASFSARAHWAPSIIGNKGSSVFPETSVGVASTLCLMNSSKAKRILQSLNPGIGFEVQDVNRLPVFAVRGAVEIYANVQEAFGAEEAAREASVEFKQPGPSPWRYAQDWAQRAVDRPDGEPLPPYEPEHDPPAPEAHVSFAIGVALGRFGANGEGIVGEAPPAEALPAGILFVSGSPHLRDSLDHPAAARIEAAWQKHYPAILGGKRQSLRDWLRKDFFAYHKALYEKRPIYLPLASEKRSFIAYVSIHRWADNTLQTLLVDQLLPTLRQLDGEIADVNQARATSDKKAASAAEKQYSVLKKLRDELGDFIAAVTECAERGAPPTDASCPARAADAPFRMDLDDGVMINSAALWPLCEPLWSDPKKWWKQLCRADKDKDYDWAHLARRYFPARVDDKCKVDPSLAVAHGAFWRYHPEKAYAWELRLQHEIGPDFTIDEADSNDCRARFLREHAAETAGIRAKEEQRRARAEAKGLESASEQLLLEGEEGDA